MKFKRTFIIFFLVSGFIVSGFGVLGIYNAMQCKKWDKVRGHIIGSTVAETLNAPKGFNSAGFVPDIVYEYKYKGQTFFSQTIAFLPGLPSSLQDAYYASSEDAALEFIKKYPIDSEVDVYVNPDDSNLSIIDTSLQFPVFLLAIFGLLLIYFAVHLALFGDRYTSAKSPNAKEA